MFEDILKAAGIELKRKTNRKRERVHLKGGIPYTPQVFPPEEAR